MGHGICRRKGGVSEQSVTSNGSGNGSHWVGYCFDKHCCHYIYQALATNATGIKQVNSDAAAYMGKVLEFSHKSVDVVSQKK